MKKIVFICLLSIIHTTFSVAQKRTKSCIQADSLFELGEYESSKLKYDSEVGVFDKENATTYFYCQTQRSECSIRLNDLETTQAIVDEALLVCSSSNVNERASLKNIQAKIYYQKGLLSQADNQIMSAIDLLKRTISFDKVVLAECYNTAGLVNWISGNDEKALEYLNESLELRKQLFGINSAPVASVYNNIGLVYSGIDSESAISYYEDALAIFQSIYPSTHPSIAVAYSNLGQAYRKQHVYNTSLIQYEKALAIWNQRYLGMHPNKAFVYSSMSQVYEDKKEFTMALTEAKNALVIYKEAYGEKHPNTAACYTLIGSIYTEQSEYDLALDAFQSALVSNCNGFSNISIQTNPGVKEYFDGQLLLSTLTHKAIALSKRESEKTLRIKDVTLALSTYQVCDTLLDKLRQTRTSKNDKIALGMYSYDIYDKSIDLCLLLSENTFRKEFYLTLGYYFVERSKASVLQESIAESQAKMYAGIPSTEIEKEEIYKTTIAYLEQRLAKGIVEESIRKSISSQLFEVKRTYESFIYSLEVNYPAYYNLKYNVKPITVKTLQSKLNATDCILEYFISESSNSIRVFRITKDSYKVFSMPIMETYEKYISGMRNSIKFNNKPTFIKTSIALYNQLIPELPTKITHLIVIPDGRMGAIPFEALMESKPKSDTLTYSKMSFLIKDYAISYNYAGTLYDNQMQQKAIQRILLFAPVNFSTGSDLTSLPGTLKEVDSLNALFKTKGQSTLYTYTSASKDILTRDSIRQYSIIHLATHGLVDEEQPELSCIYTCGTSEENDRIYSGDMYNMHLNANLVTLSACQTALGKIAKGEGMIGLSRALFYAGADNINVSLWKVSDLSTQVYMNYFYTDYLNNTKKTFAESSRNAKIKLLNSADFNNPYYWSAFVLIGN